MNNDNTIQKIIKEYSLKDIHNLLVQSDDYYYNNIYPDEPMSSSAKSFIELTDEQYDYIREYYNSKNTQPYKNIGAEIKQNKVALPIHMGSMDKIKKGSTELKSFLKKYNHNKCISEKLDGISLLLDMTSKTIKAYTRGDGSYGQNVTHIIPFIKNLKKVLTKFNKELYCGYIRGELLIKKGNWAKISHKGKNARNYVAGLANKKDSDKDDFEYVDFVAYQYIPSPISNEIITPSFQLKFLEKKGFDVAKYEVVHSKDVNDEWLIDKLLEFKEKSEYEIDGIIVTDDFAHPFTLSGNPSYAKAFKFNSIDEAVTSTVKKVEWNISKDGKLKPTVIIQPVNIDGVTIQKATAFNARYIVDNKIGIGSIIRIIRSGGVIPYIVGVVEGKTPDLPDMKKENLIWDANNVDIMLNSYNTNDDSNSMSDDSKSMSDDTKSIDELTMSEKMDVKRIEYFVNTMGIEFYKAKTIQKGYLYANIKNIFDLLRAKEETFEKIEGIKQKTSRKIVASIKKQIMTEPIYVFAAAVSVFKNMGVKKLEQLFAHKDEQLVSSKDIINDIINYYSEPNTPSYNRGIIANKISSISGFSYATGIMILDSFPAFLEMWEFIKSNFPTSKIANYLNDNSTNSVSNNEEVTSSTELKYSPLQNIPNMIVVFSGFRDNDLEDHIKRYGGRVNDNVTKSNNIAVLIVKDKDKASSKQVKAQLYGYKIMTKEEFINEYKL